MDEHYKSNSPIDELEVLTALIPKGNTIENRKSQYVELTVRNGTAFSEGLLTREKIALAHTIASDGSEFQTHYHPEREVIVVYEGALKVWRGVGTEDEKYTLVKEREVFICDPNVSHRAVAIGDTRFVAITMPASKDFPNARQE